MPRHAQAARPDKEGLRPLYLVVLQSVVSALSGIRLPWHKLERTGLDSDLVKA